MLIQLCLIMLMFYTTENIFAHLISLVLRRSSLQCAERVCVCVCIPLTAPLSTVAVCRVVCVSGTWGARCCCGGVVDSFQETAVAVATPALVRTSLSALQAPSASPPGTASPAPGPHSAWGLHSRNNTFHNPVHKSWLLFSRQAKLQPQHLITNKVIQLEIINAW